MRLLRASKSNKAIFPSFSNLYWSYSAIPACRQCRLRLVSVNAAGAGLPKNLSTKRIKTGAHVASF